MGVSGAREEEDVGSAGQSHASKLLGGSEMGENSFCTARYHGADPSGRAV